MVADREQVLAVVMPHAGDGIHSRFVIIGVEEAAARLALFTPRRSVEADRRRTVLAKQRLVNGAQHSQAFQVRSDHECEVTSLVGAVVAHPPPVLETRLFELDIDRPWVFCRIVNAELGDVAPVGPGFVIRGHGRVGIVQFGFPDESPRFGTEGPVVGSDRWLRQFLPGLIQLGAPRLDRITLEDLPRLGLGLRFARIPISPGPVGFCSPVGRSQ